MADIHIHYGSNPEEMTVRLLQSADVAGRIRPGARVLIKPNLVVSRPAQEGATTHPEIVEGVIRYLQDHGVRDITVAEGAWVGDSTRRAFAACGYQALAERYGVRLLDTKSDDWVEKKSAGYSLKICKSVLQADFLINIPVLKGHCQTGMTCCLKNLKGCIPDSEKRRYHTLGLHGPIAALGGAVRPHLHIVDSICGDLNFEEGGNPIDSHRILLGYDAVLLDSYCAGLLGYRPEEIGYLCKARENGVGRFADAATQVVEYAAGQKPAALAKPTGAAGRLAAYVEEAGACSACYAALLYALEKTGARPGERVKIGQGFRGKAGAGAGVGNCTSGCERHVGGCPPRAVDIAAFLESL